MTGPQPDRAQRLAAALRENLRRRKQQARATGEEQAEPPPTRVVPESSGRP